MSIAPLALRYDGLYRGPVEQITDTLQSVTYLRFYDDPLVVSVAATTEESPESIAKWFHRDFEGAGRGEWTAEGDRISFTDVTHEGRRTIEVEWTGRIEQNALVLDSKSKRHSATAQRFEFVPVD